MHAISAVYTAELLVHTYWRLRVPMLACVTECLQTSLVNDVSFPEAEAAVVRGR